MQTTSSEYCSASPSVAIRNSKWLLMKVMTCKYKQSQEACIQPCVTLPVAQTVYSSSYTGELLVFRNGHSPKGRK
jgi:hypothetical protein